MWVVTWLRRTANRNAVLVLGMASALLVFVGLVDGVREKDWVLRCDRAVQAWSLRHDGGLLDSMARVVNQLCDGWVVALVVVVGSALLWRRGPRSAAFVLTASSAVSPCGVDGRRSAMSDAIS